MTFVCTSSKKNNLFRATNGRGRANQFRTDAPSVDLGDALFCFGTKAQTHSSGYYIMSSNKCWVLNRVNEAFKSL